MGFRSAKKRLVVFVPGLDLSVRRCRALLDQLQKDPDLQPPVAEWLAFDRFLFRMGLRRLAAVADALAARINQRWVASGGFDEIILIGHSVGGLLVRQAYLIAAGASSEARYAWASAVTRIVLLAAPNRGVSKLSMVRAVGDWFVRVFLFFGHFTYQDLLAGSTFVTNLRLEWIRYFRSLPSGASAPLVIQLLGTNDDIVKQTDSQDVLAFQNSVTIKLSGGTHRSIAVLPRAKGEITEEAREWAEIIRRSMLGTPESLGLAAATSPAPRDERASSPARVVFVLHGIRARDIDEWLSEVQAEIHRQDPSAKIIRPRYGYFTALRFVLPSVRRRNIRHLQDLYAEHLAENPHAEFHFIGHSNGTYMFGRSLSEIPAMRFERVVLAGSVLPVDLFRPESALLRQVTAVRSDCGQLDWPVGILCRILNKALMMRDVGTGGYDGFIGDFVTEVRYHAGGHGGMFTAQNVKSMVRFVLEGESDPPAQSLVGEDQRFRMGSFLAPYFVRLILLVILAAPLFPHGPNWLHWYIGVAVGVMLTMIVLDII